MGAAQANGRPSAAPALLARPGIGAGGGAGAARPPRGRAARGRQRRRGVIPRVLQVQGGQGPAPREDQDTQTQARGDVGGWKCHGCRCSGFAAAEPRWECSCPGCSGTSIPPPLPITRVSGLFVPLYLENSQKLSTRTALP